MSVEGFVLLLFHFYEVIHCLIDNIFLLLMHVISPVIARNTES